MSKDAREKAWDAAGRLLAYRSRSEQELRSRLARRGFEAPVIDETVERLRALGLLDDGAFAREKTESLLRRGTGPRLVRARLASSGIGAQEAGPSLDSAVEAAGGEKALAAETVARRYGDLAGADALTRQKAAAWLVRRGFRPSVAGAVCGIFVDVEE